ncbi:hypothetical protein AN401_06895 [Zobellella denitrificans]|jgi:ABC-type transporter MlaC component|uniref:Late embryogenesis abundant protein n=1 Tax=Zobellella denitrificans TaxID=347534 RepID=A0A291HN98_9GAMM|nr:hypothetical protein [Zobellella denitrificans]ATG73614.1 hypothetical protein AN401_06895 [Zobellella denitrificans]
MKKSLLNVLLFTSVTAFGLAACDNQGPAEQAGENVDEVIENVQEQGEQMTDDAAEALGVEQQGTMEALGEKLDDAASSAADAADDAMDAASEQAAEMEQAMDEAAAEAEQKLNELMEESNQ